MSRNIPPALLHEDMPIPKQLAPCLRTRRVNVIMGSLRLCSYLDIVEASRWGKRLPCVQHLLGDGAVLRAHVGARSGNHARVGASFRSFGKVRHPRGTSPCLHHSRELEARLSRGRRGGLLLTPHEGALEAWLSAAGDARSSRWKLPICNALYIWKCM